MTVIDLRDQPRRAAVTKVEGDSTGTASGPTTDGLIWRVAVADALSAATVVGAVLLLGPDSSPAVVAAVMTAMPIALYASGAYDSRFISRRRRAVGRVVTAAGRAMVALTLLPLVVAGFDAVGAVTLTAALAVAVILARLGVAGRLRRAQRAGELRTPILARGTASELARFLELLDSENAPPYEVVAVQVTDDRIDEALGGQVVVPRSVDPVKAAVSYGAAVVAFVGFQAEGSAALRRFVWQLEAEGIDAHMVPIVATLAKPQVETLGRAGLPLLAFQGRDRGAEMGFTKVVLDKLLAALGLVLIAPLMFGIALAVKATSSGPVLFRQARVGRDGKQFTMLKFRTMHRDAEARLAELVDLNRHEGGTLFKIADDPRVTRVGRVLRRYSLDELPQLVNVVRGEMSLVGPRPPLPSEVANYAPDAHRRFRVRPGLTGLWQVSGRSDLDPSESTRLDTHYVEHWSVGMDLQILARTAKVVLTGDGAY